MHMARGTVLFRVITSRGTAFVGPSAMCIAEGLFFCAFTPYTRVTMEVEITVLDQRYADYASRLKQILMLVASNKGIAGAHVEAYIVGNSFMEKNVLAYPTPDNFPRPDLLLSRDLGELYINPEYIISHGEDFVFMAVHAFLHLLGYDHHGKHDTVKMEEQEQKIISAINPLLSHE